jgi:hypothetical protein
MSRVITFKCVDVVSGEETTFQYNADAKELTQNRNSAIQVMVVSDEEEE